MKKEKLHLRNEVKIMIISFLTGVALGITIYQFFTVKTVDKSGATCKGGIIKICSGTYSQYKKSMSK